MGVSDGRLSDPVRRRARRKASLACASVAMAFFGFAVGAAGVAVHADAGKVPVWAGVVAIVGAGLFARASSRLRRDADPWVRYDALLTVPGRLGTFPVTLALWVPGVVGALVALGCFGPSRVR